MLNPVTPVVFDADELWVLQAVLRHEVQQRDTWTYPPANLELNDSVADALLVCQEYDLKEITLLLDRAALLAIDYCVPQTAKSADGKLLGKNILIKSFRARRVLQEGEGPIATDPSRESRADIRSLLSEWEKLQERE